MAISLASLAMAPPTNSLSLLTGKSRSGGSSLSVGKMPCTHSSPPLYSSFLSFPSTTLSFPSYFSGLSLGINLGFNKAISEKRRGLQLRAGKAALCLTKRNRSRKSLARTHGFRRRLRTTGGRAILKRRRAKGRKVLCTKTNPNSGKAS